MNKVIILIFILFGLEILAQPFWQIVAYDIDQVTYYGVNVDNGKADSLSSDEPLSIEDVKPNGEYDYYQRERVSNIFRTINQININIDVIRKRMGKEQNAAESLKNSYKLNEVTPYVISEALGGANPYFVAGASVLLQTVLFGTDSLKIGYQRYKRNEAHIPATCDKPKITSTGIDDKAYTCKK